MGNEPFVGSEINLVVQDKSSSFFLNEIKLNRTNKFLKNEEIGPYSKLRRSNYCFMKVLFHMCVGPTLRCFYM